MESQRFQKPKLCIPHIEQIWYQTEPWQTFRPNQKEERKEENKTDNKLEKLQEDLKQAIKEERYEDAAKIRDEIKKKEK